jgi:hypothetical protein
MCQVGLLYDACVNNSSTATAGAWWFRIAFAGSITIAFFVWNGPQRRMPLDYQFIWSWGLALSALWLVVVVVSAFLFRKKMLWLLIGAPLVVYWPIWLAFNGLPVCYWHANCL